MKRATFITIMICCMFAAGSVFAQSMEDFQNMPATTFDIFGKDKAEEVVAETINTESPSGCTVGMTETTDLTGMGELRLRENEDSVVTEEVAEAPGRENSVLDSQLMLAFAGGTTDIGSGLFLTATGAEKKELWAGITLFGGIGFRFNEGDIDPNLEFTGGFGNRVWGEMNLSINEGPNLLPTDSFEFTDPRVDPALRSLIGHFGTGTWAHLNDCSFSGPCGFTSEVGPLLSENDPIPDIPEPSSTPPDPCFTDLDFDFIGRAVGEVGVVEGSESINWDPIFIVGLRTNCPWQKNEFLKHFELVGDFTYEHADFEYDVSVPYGVLEGWKNIEGEWELNKSMRWWEPEGRCTNRQWMFGYCWNYNYNCEGGCAATLGEARGSVEGDLDIYSFGVGPRVKVNLGEIFKNSKPAKRVDIGAEVLYTFSIANLDTDFSGLYGNSYKHGPFTIMPGESVTDTEYLHGMKVSADVTVHVIDQSERKPDAVFRGLDVTARYTQTFFRGDVGNKFVSIPTDYQAGFVLLEIPFTGCNLWKKNGGDEVPPEITGTPTTPATRKPY